MYISVRVHLPKPLCRSWEKLPGRLILYRHVIVKYNPHSRNSHIYNPAANRIFLQFVVHVKHKLIDLGHILLIHENLNLTDMGHLWLRIHLASIRAKQEHCVNLISFQLPQDDLFHLLIGFVKKKLLLITMMKL